MCYPQTRLHEEAQRRMKWALHDYTVSKVAVAAAQAAWGKTWDVP
jgi:hypothetical protein